MTQDNAWGLSLDELEGRHPGTAQLVRWLTPNPNLPEGAPTRVARLHSALAAQLVRQLPDGPELTAGLRKLLEAKDCFVRAALDDA
jgi:hypothetical protein